MAHIIQMLWFTHTHTHMFLDWYTIGLKCFIIFFFGFHAISLSISFLLNSHIEHVSTHLLPLHLPLPLHLLPVFYFISLSLSGISLLSPSLFSSLTFCCTIPFYGDCLYRCEHLSCLICPALPDYPLRSSTRSTGVPSLPCLLDISQSNYVYLDSFCDTLESNFSDWLS